MLALHGESLALRALDRVMRELASSLSPGLMSQLDALRCVMSSDSCLPWAPPLGAGPTELLMFRQLALGSNTVEDFEAGLFMALLQIDGKVVSSIPQQILQVAKWFLQLLSLKQVKVQRQPTELESEPESEPESELESKLESLSNI